MKVLTYPHKSLTKKAAPVKAFNNTIRDLARKMFQLMYKENGVGLAATQIGEACRLIVVNPTKKSSDEIVLVNPQIAKSSGNICEEEGCLSLPGISAKVNRSLKITCHAFNLKGEKINDEFEDILARVVQHEIDHLNGILFVDRLSPGEKDALIKKYLRSKNENIQGF